MFWNETPAAVGGVAPGEALGLRVESTTLKLVSLNCGTETDACRRPDLIPLEAAPGADHSVRCIRHAEIAPYSVRFTTAAAS